MRSFFIALFVLLGCTSLFARKPNVVVVLTDDQGWGDLSLNGNTNLSTPNIDSLARDGASFDRFYVCPVCSPTRAEFLTGRYHPRSGVYSTSAGGERMDLDETTIADRFKSAGYATAAFGKWHNGMQYPYHPNGRGFDYYYGFCSGHWGNYFDPMLERNGQITKGEGFVIDDFTNEAMEFMERHKDEPFFVYLPFNTPHSPMQVPDRFWEKFKDHDLPMRHRDKKENMSHARAALAMCENVDWNVGRLLGKLDELKLANDTIVVFFHDNGPNGSRWNGGMKGRKGSTDEGGVRSPLLMRWPGTIAKGKKVKEIAAAIDLLPTLADLASLTTPGTAVELPQFKGAKSPVKVTAMKQSDGVSLKPLLTQSDVDWPERMIFNSWRQKVSVRTQRYRLDNNGKLFDILADPRQDHPVTDKPALQAKLQAAADDWRAELNPGDTNDERPFVIGHPDYKYTQIPARDGIAHGGIERSNRFPNCSFFSNWKSLDDKITWTAELPADGKFEVDVYYTCPAVDVGSTIELSFGDAKIEAQITEANDPPLRGAEHDRSPRTESYVKDFRPLRMGTIDLHKGKGELTLRATAMPHSQVMDFRLIMLTRIE